MAILFYLTVFGPVLLILIGPFVAFRLGRRVHGAARRLLTVAAGASVAVAIGVWLDYLARTLGLPGCPTIGWGFIGTAYAAILGPLLLLAASAGTFKQREVAGYATAALGGVALLALVRADQTIFCGLGN